MSAEDLRYNAKVMQQTRKTTVNTYSRQGLTDPGDYHIAQEMALRPALHFNPVRQIYQAAGAEDRCRLVVGAEGHRFYAAEAWPVFEEVCRGAAAEATASA